MFLWGNLVNWQSKKQIMVARSSTETKLRAMANGLCEVLWIKIVLGELRLNVEGTISIVNNLM